MPFLSSSLSDWPRGRMRAGLLALVCCLWQFAATPLRADKGGLLQLPAGRLNPSGVRMTVDSRWVDAVGYRPIRIEIVPRKPPTADRQFRIVIRPDGNRDQITQIVELPEGATRATATIAVQQDATTNSFAIEVFEDGARLEDLSTDWRRYGNNRWDWNEANPGLLLIDFRAPSLNQQEMMLTTSLPGSQALEKVADIRNMVRSFPDSNEGRSDNQYFVDETQSKTSPVNMILHEVNRSAKSAVLHPDELPQRWIEYTSFDLIVISQADLLKLKASHAPVLQALGDWTRAGHTLVVYNSGDSFSGLKQLEQQLQLSPITLDEDAEYRGWRFPNPKLRGRGLVNYIEHPYNRVRTKQAATYSGNEEDFPQTVESLPDSLQEDDWIFAIRPAGLGQVIAFAGDPFPGSKRDWDWMLNTIPGSGWNPLVRTAASQQHLNEDFWNFLIPGTGQAPVLSFLVLISGFVMLIGPVNYFFLQRRQRLYLLLVTVPAGAFLVTLSLFLYALVTDGLGVKSRVRSYTVLDQRNGLGASISRQAYYASIAPSQGLRFEEDTAVLPYMHRPRHHDNQQTFRRNVIWSDREQQLKSGYLSSRSLSQLIVTKSGATKARLQIGQASGGQLPVTNELGGTLKWLLVVDHDGNCFRSQMIKPGQSQVPAVDRETALSELKQQIEDAVLEFPDGYSENMHETLQERMDGPRTTRSPVHQNESLLEQKLTRLTELEGRPLEPGTYFAIIDHSPLVPLGTRTRSYSSLQVIEGTW